MAGGAQRADRWRGPWVGLLLVGAGLWGLARLARPDPGDVVEVSAPTLTALREDFERQQGRPPTPEQTLALVDDWVETQLLVREARARGLDRADLIVRRRLAQKMRFVLEDASPVVDPGDQVLQRWVSDHADRYRRPARRGFTHVFVAGHTAQAEAAASRWVERLGGGEDPTGRGDAFAHGPRQGPADAAALARRYGEGFAQAVSAAPRDRWFAAESSFGWHAVRVDASVPGAVPPLPQIRPRVLADWQQQQRADNLERGLAALRQQARVQVAP